MLRQFLKQMPMKIETPVDSKALGEDQDMVLKGVVVDLHITITNPAKKYTCLKSEQRKEAYAET